MFFLSAAKEKIEVREKEYFEGGQAVVYFPVSHPGSVVKIYKQKPAPAETEKLAYMITNPPADPCNVDGHISFAWPQAFIYDPSMHIAGYLMPRIQRSATVLDVFNPHRRKVLKLQTDWRFLLGVAANLASVTASLHERNYVIGDINEGNVLVNNRALVTLIDVDSFQVEAGGKLFPCPVGKEEYTPREVLEKGFAGRRSACSDDFGLAVMVYQLLLEGSHPFRGVWKEKGDPPPVGEKIRRGHFPYTAGSPNQPVAALRPRFGDLPDPIQQLFYQAFIDGHAEPTARPSAAEWHKTLRAALKEFRTCSANPGHFYFGHSPSCPWCFRKQSSPTVQPKMARQKAQEVKQPAQPAPQYVPQSAPPTAQPAAVSPTNTPPPPQKAKGKASAPPKTKPRPQPQPIANQPLVNKTVLDYGERFAGDGRGAWRKLILTNSTSRPLTLSLSSPESWVAFSEDRFLLLPGTVKEVRVKLLPKKMPARAGDYNATAAVRIDPGTLFQVVRLKGKLIIPDLALSADTCVFTATYRYQKMVQEVALKNRGAAVNLTVTTKEKWISVSPPKIKLEAGKIEILRLIIDPSALPQKVAKKLVVGKVQIKGPGGYAKDLLVALRGQ